MTKTLNIAHRGANAEAPENTLAAFRKAVEIGADGFEFDLQLSRDNVPVVIHDEMLERTTNGNGLVKDYTLDELKAFDAGSWFSPEFAGETIPTLEEVFEEFAQSEALFNIELKSGIIIYPELEEKVLKIISRFKVKERVLISSFNHYSLVTCLQIDPEVRTGILYMAGLYEPWNYAKSLGCYSAHPLFYHLQHPEIVSGFKEHSIPVFAWTVNDPLYMKMMVAGGIEGIITDNPRELKKIIGKTSE
ncbi:MAG: glycerophosphodiester phosphodiesterase [Firmicutes bacterium]|nr:glycerophosphodiester phosphodiesterase [Bacillota bacterium]